MPKLTINGIKTEVERGTTVLEAAQFLGIPIPTLCHDDGLTPYGACRLCVVEVGTPPQEQAAERLHPPGRGRDGGADAFQARVERARQLLLELYVATCPQSKTIQDLASSHGLRRVRLEPKNEDCIQCGICVRMCAEQMMAGPSASLTGAPTAQVIGPFTPPFGRLPAVWRLHVHLPGGANFAATARVPRRRCAVAASISPRRASTITITPCVSWIPAWPANWPDLSSGAGKRTDKPSCPTSARRAWMPASCRKVKENFHDLFAT